MQTKERILLGGSMGFFHVYARVPESQLKALAIVVSRRMLLLWD